MSANSQQHPQIYDGHAGQLDFLQRGGSQPPPPPEPGEIHGTKWNDLDGDGSRDAGEPGLANWRVYVDTNHNGQWDSGEPSDLTDSSGAYALTDPAAGTSTVGEVVQSGWQQT